MHVMDMPRRKPGFMRTACGRLALLVLVSLCAATASHAASLDPAVLPKIQAATFEVVAAKPVKDPLSYEKPLPLELLPFQERNDKYYSIGTAFALGNHRYVTAAHVLQIGIDSLWGEPALRDASGHVYAIDKVEKFSLQQDFVVFTLAEQPASAAALEVNPKPALNEVVYAVGNALGTGVVIRDGLYTSDTPEEQDGRWKWMRFSAAASPGNSGGPLLDTNGKLIGIVLMKSANENLNYALPIHEILDAPDRKASMDSRGAYQLDLFDARQNGTFKAQFALPLSLAAFYREYQKHLNAFSDEQIKALLARESPNLFPQGQGSAKLLYQQTQLTGFPQLIMRGSTGEWALNGNRSRHLPLDGNGYLDVGGVGRNGLAHLRRPDGVDVASFYGDAKLRMDLMAKTGMFQRTVGSENVKITSFGKPSFQTEHMDRWQRPWHVEIWPMPYANALMMIYSLPVPDGTVMLTRFVPASGKYDARLDMDELSNFVYTSYEGTLAQWKQFVARPALLPAAFKNIHLDFDYDHRFSYASQRVAFSYTPELQVIKPDNLLYLGFRFLLDKQKPAWDVGAVLVWKTPASDDKNNVVVQRFVAPPVGLDEDLTSQWQKISQRRYPYNAVARQEDGLMKINGVVAAAADDGHASVLYSPFYGVEGSHSQDEMKQKLDLLTRDLRVSEP
ncbi:trypsin-like peptidase domain-containing protein [Rhodanobacter ginsengiterrae]|uniref:S1 family peptidase n=1 Tax=Rhodanobacter ginsengiterrae TaxID=2008451 RepID=UPI003CEEAA64